MRYRRSISINNQYQQRTNLDPDRLEQLRMAQRKLDHLLDQGQLLANAADVVVADLVDVFLLILALDRIAVAVDLCAIVAISRDLSKFVFFLFRLQNNKVILTIGINNVCCCVIPSYGYAFSIFNNTTYINYYILQCLSAVKLTGQFYGSTSSGQLYGSTSSGQLYLIWKPFFKKLWPII